MTTRGNSAACLLAFAMTAALVAQMTDLRLGQWRNVKDPQNVMTYSADGKALKTEVVNVSRDGNKNVWFYTSLLDGSDAIITNGGNRHIAAVKRVDQYVNEIVYKGKDGQVTQLATNVVSKDGKMLTVTFKTPEGKETNVAVYEKIVP